MVPIFFKRLLMKIYGVNITYYGRKKTDRLHTLVTDVPVHSDGFILIAGTMPKSQKLSWIARPANGLYKDYGLRRMGQYHLKLTINLMSVHESFQRLRSISKEKDK